MNVNIICSTIAVETAPIEKCSEVCRFFTDSDRSQRLESLRSVVECCVRVQDLFGNKHLVVSRRRAPVLNEQTVYSD